MCKLFVLNKNVWNHKIGCKQIIIIRCELLFETIELPEKKTHISVEQPMNHEFDIPYPCM